MTRRTDAQTMLTELVLFGMFIPDPKQLLDPELQRLDEVLDDEPLVDAVVEKLRARHPRSRRRGRPSTPADVVLRILVGAVERHIELFGKPPKTAATDRGFHSIAGEQRIQQLGVAHAAIPKPGPKGKARTRYERQRWFKRARAWRSGGEARISRLKHTFGIARSRYRGMQGMARAVAWAGIANNLVAIARA